MNGGCIILCDKYINMIKERLDKNKFYHSLGVAETAQKLAKKYSCDPEKAYIAGLMHDWGKNIPAKELINISEKNNLATTWIEKKNTELLHGPVGAWLLQEQGIIDDEEILRAITYHTTGTVNMSTLEKIVYIADMIEPNRKYPFVEELREMTWQSLDKGVLLGIDNTVRYIIKRGWLLHPLTIEARNWLIKQKMEDYNGIY